MLTSFFKNLSFKKKIILICLAVSLVPVAILGIFSYFQLQSLLTDREKTALSDSLMQETTALDKKMEEFDSVLKNIIWNDSLTEALNRSYSGTYEMYIAYRDIIDPIFSNLKLFNTNIETITLYSDSPQLYPHGTLNRPIKELDADAFAALSDTQTRSLWTVSENAITLLGCFNSSSKNTLTVVEIDINYASVFQALSFLYEQYYGIVLTDSSGQLIYEYHSPDMELRTLSAAQLSSAVQNPDGCPDYIIESSKLSTNQWNLYLYRPAAAINAPASEIAKTVLFVIIFCLFYVILFSSILSKAIVRPLEELTADVQQMEQGNYTITATYHSRDEIGNLIQSFKNMAQHMDLLVNEILKAKILEQKYALQALQAQINPHFLYNTLSLINSKAILTGQRDIGKIAQFLSTFYRTTLNRGSNYITIQDELKNVKSYINIQLIMHSNSFDVTYDIDDSILDLTAINLILQPIVENAILHGIDHIQKPERGLLKISGKSKDSLLIFQISDNGPGIPADKLPLLLAPDSSKGYGAKNVHTRIQLFYGVSYGLHYESAPGCGTVVTVTLPKILPDTDDSTPLQTP